MTVDSSLLKILVCPEDKGPLHYLEAESVLYNPRLGRTYAIVDDIPIMLIEESVQLSDEERARLDSLIASS